MHLGSGNRRIRGSRPTWAKQTMRHKETNSPFIIECFCDATSRNADTKFRITHFRNALTFFHFQPVKALYFILNTLLHRRCKQIPEGSTRKIKKNFFKKLETPENPTSKIKEANKSDLRIVRIVHILLY